MSEFQHPAVARLYAFLTEMNRWEVQSIALSNVLESLTEAEYHTRRTALDELRRCIFAKYVLLRAKQRLEPGSTGAYSPDYDPALEHVLRVEEERGSIAIYTQSANQFKHAYLYTMKLKDGEWKIVNDRRYQDGDRWEEWPL